MVAGLALLYLGCAISQVSTGEFNKELEPPSYLKNLKQPESSKSTEFQSPGDEGDEAGGGGSCQRTESRCVSEGDVTCYGTRLPYSATGPALTNSSEADWVGLQSIPACWATVQPLLCSLLSPRCDPDTRVTSLVPRLLCRAAVRPCRVLSSISDLPPFLDCNNDQIFSDRCDQGTRQSERAKFNLNASCVAPLVRTETESAFWPEIEECGMRCQSPVLTSSEYITVHSFIAGAATISLLASLFAIFTFFVDWKGGSSYPARAIFYLNLCFVLVNIGWLAQFVGSGARDDIVCRKDGVARHEEPGSGENLSCVVVFILVYYFSLAGGVWLVVVSYTWHLTLTWASQPNKVRSMLTKRAPYFHIAAWSLPAVLTITILALNKVSGSYITGICFVGHTSPVDQALLVFLPLSCALAAAGLFTVRSVRILSDILREVRKGVLPAEGGGKVRRTVVRILVFSVTVTASLLTSIICYVYRVTRQEDWDKALEEVVLCNVRNQLGQQGGECQMVTRPSTVMIQLELFTVFTVAVLSSSWVWTRNSVNTWSLAVRQLLTKQERPVKIHKHQLIAQAFAKRAELQANGRLSLNFQSCHEDPLGLGLEVTPESSQASDGWAAALPHLIQRRGGLCGADQLGLVPGTRRNSIGSVSNISRSFSVRSGGLSWFGSRKGSSVSNTSIQQSDLERLQSIYDEAVRSNKKRSKRDFFKSHKYKMRPWSRSTSRRNSVTSRASDNSSSIFSGYSAAILPAITLDPKKLKSKNKYSLPSPGRSRDFGGNLAVGAAADDPSYQELHERLRELALSRTSNNTDNDIKISLDIKRPETCSIETQTEVLELAQPAPARHLISTGRSEGNTEHVSYLVLFAGTQMTPQLGQRELPSQSPPPLVPPASSPLQHIEANVVNIKVLGPSSEDSSIPSSYEKDFKMKRISTSKGKENFHLVPSQDSCESESLSILVGDVNIPVLKKLGEADGGGVGMRPRDHKRGRRGAILKLSPGGNAVNTSSNTTDS